MNKYSSINNNELITDINYYKKYLNTDLGKQIAINGYNHVRNKFKTSTNTNLKLVLIHPFEHLRWAPMPPTDSSA